MKRPDILFEMMHAFCDKCGGAVTPDNNVLYLKVELSGNNFNPAFYYGRHLLPVVENGMRKCEGSPSRAQYLEGQPRDLRGYPYLPEYEQKLREAYARLQTKYNKPPTGAK